MEPWLLIIQLSSSDGSFFAFAGRYRTRFDCGTAGYALIAKEKPGDLAIRKFQCTNRLPRRWPPWTDPSPREIYPQR